MNQFRSRKLMAALSLFAANGLLAVLSSYSQTPIASYNNIATAKDEPEVLENFVVTGSNLPVAAEALAVPVTVVDQTQMQQTGVSTNVLDILRKMLPNVTGTGQENATSGTGKNQGGAELSINRLSTLVLLDGRRVAFSPVSGTGGHEFVDLNLIPAAAIERIEVLTGGGSAIYGSDAVGGVVNVITKKNFNGWEADVHYGYSTGAGRYNERTASLVGGVANDKTSILVGLDYSSNPAIFMNQRQTTNPIFGTRSIPGVIDVTNLSTNADQYYQLAPGLNAPPPGAQTIDQLVAAGVYKPITTSQALNLFNLANGQTLAQSMKRYSVMVNADHQIFDDRLEAFVDVLGTNTKTRSQLNAQPVVPYLSDPYMDVQFAGVTPPPAGVTYVPTTSPNNPFSTAYVDGATDGSQGNLIFVRNRFITFPRIYQNDSTLFRVVGGLRGKINENYSWEIAANIDRFALNFTNSGLINTNALQLALNNGTINPWALTQASGAFNGVIGQAFVDEVSTLNQFDAKITGTPFELPAGKVSFAVGVNYNRENLTAEPDVNSLPNASGTTQGWSNATTYSNFSALRTVFSYYGELNIPILSANQNIVGAHSLTLDGAVRSDKYNYNVGTSTNPQVSLAWAPFDDQFKIRLSAGKSFIAPTLYNLFGPAYSGSSDPINYTALGGAQQANIQFNAIRGPNAALKSQTATTKSLGFVYTPKAVKNLTLTVDYSDTNMKNVPGYIPQQMIVQSVESLGAASPYANYIRFNNPTTGPVVTAPGQISVRSPQAVWIIANLVNFGGVEVKSTNAALEYTFDTDSFGRFGLRSNWTIYNSYRELLSPQEPYYSYAGYASITAGTVPRWRNYSVVDWTMHGFDIFVGATFIPHVYDIGSGGSSADAPVYVSAYNQVDVGLTYDFKHLAFGHGLDGLSVTVGINNIADHAPPLAPDAFPDANGDTGYYNGSIGRMFYIDAKYKF